MLKIDKFNKIIILFISLTLSLSAFLGFRQITKIIPSKVSLLTEMSVGFSNATARIDSITKDLLSTKSGANTSRKEQTSHKNHFILYMFALMFVVSADKNVLILMLLCSMALLAKILYKRKEVHVKSAVPRLKFYLFWCLRFLTPAEKYRKNRSDNFDINPLIGLMGGYRVSNFSPHSVL